MMRFYLVSDGCAQPDVEVHSGRLTGVKSVLNTLLSHENDF